MVAFSTLFLSSCAQKDLIDIYLFSQRFSENSENFEIDTTSLTAKEEGDVLRFPLVFADKILLTVDVSNETFLIRSFSVTYMFDKSRKITDKDFLSFLEISRSASMAFTNSENINDVFAEFSLETKSDVQRNNHVFCEKGFYKYSFVSDELGFYFTVSTERR